MDPEYKRLLAVLKHPESAVRAAWRVGSRVYGTASPDSDHDYVVVLSNPAQKQDLLFGDDINVVLHGSKTFEAALADGGVFAFEAIFAPPAHVLKPPRPPFSYKLDRKKLAESAIARSTSDFEKARKRFEEEPLPSKKKLFHSLRVPLFALQLLRTGKLTDFAIANDHFRAIMAEEGLEFGPFEARYGPVRAALCDEIRKLAGRR